MPPKRHRSKKGQTDDDKKTKTGSGEASDSSSDEEEEEEEEPNKSTDPTAPALPSQGTDKLRQPTVKSDGEKKDGGLSEQTSFQQPVAKPIDHKQEDEPKDGVPTGQKPPIQPVILQDGQKQDSERKDGIPPEKITVQQPALKPINQKQEVEPTQGLKPVEQPKPVDEPKPVEIPESAEKPRSDEQPRIVADPKLAERHDDTSSGTKPVLKAPVKPGIQKKRRASLAQVSKRDWSMTGDQEPDIAPNDPVQEEIERRKLMRRREAKLKRSNSTVDLAAVNTAKMTTTAGEGTPAIRLGKKQKSDFDKSDDELSDDGLPEVELPGKKKSVEEGPEDEIETRVHDTDDEDENAVSPEERKLNEIAAMDDERKLLLKKVMVDDYRENKALGIYGEADADDHDEEDDENEEESKDEHDDDEDEVRVPDEMIDLIREGEEDKNSSVSSRKNSSASSEEEDVPEEEGTEEILGSGRPHYASDDDAVDDDDIDDDEDDGSRPDLIPKSYGKEKGFFAKHFTLKNATTATGVLTDLLNLNTFGTMGMNMQTLFSKNDSDKKAYEDKFKKYKTVNNYISLASNALSGTMNLINFFDKAYSSTNTSNLRKSNQLTAGAASHGLGLMANASKMFSSLFSIAGDPKGNSYDKAGQAMFNVLGGVFGTASSAATMIGDIKDKKARGDIMNRINSLRLSGDNDKSGDIEKRLRGEVAVAAKNKNASPKQFKKAKAKFRAMKAKKYTLQDAAEFQKIKKEHTTKGITSTITNGISTAATLFTLIPGIGEKVSGTVSALNGPLAYLINTPAKYIGMRNDKKTAGKIEDKKGEVVGKYLERKRERVEEQARAAFRKRPDAKALSTDLTDAEKDRITLGRLTSPGEVVDSPVETEEKKAAFPKLNIKRAQSIMRTDKESRKKIFAALHLAKDATIDELASALEGD